MRDGKPRRTVWRLVVGAREFIVGLEGWHAASGQSKEAGGKEKVEDSRGHRK